MYKSNLNTLPWIGANATINRAFTLVELVVVITILAILWTIAFISLQWYSAQSRDSVRISDISNMKTSLELFNLDAGKYPLPTDWTEITYSWALVWTQWYFWKTVFVNVDKLDKAPTDPLTDKGYVYSTTNTRTEFQLSQAMEGSEFVNNKKLIVNSIIATEKTAHANVTWTFNWKVVKVSSWTLNCVLALPSIVASSWTTLEKILINDLLAYNWYKNLPFQYTWAYNIKWENSLILVNYLEIEAYCGDDLSILSEQTSSWVLARKQLIENLQKAYTWTVLLNEWPIQSILQTDTNNTKITEILSTNIVRNNLWGKKLEVKIDNNITYSNCSSWTKDWYSHNSLTHNLLENVTKNENITKWTRIYFAEAKCTNWTVNIVNESINIECNTNYSWNGVSECIYQSSIIGWPTTDVCNNTTNILSSSCINPIVWAPNYQNNWICVVSKSDSNKRILFLMPSNYDNWLWWDKVWKMSDWINWVQYNKPSSWKFELDTDHSYIWLCDWWDNHFKSNYARWNCKDFDIYNDQWCWKPTPSDVSDFWASKDNYMDVYIRYWY